MTEFGPDISSFEAGVNVAALPDKFVFAKCTEGTYYADRNYAAWRDQAAATGKLFVPYHFISGEDPGAQAAWMAAHIGDTSLPVMIDWEPEGTFKPTFPQLVALIDAMTGRGLRTRLAYAPRWHWANEGSPSLAPLTQRGVSVVASSYPGGTAYPGDSTTGWAPYGGVTPALWQFTDNMTDHGQYVGDYNAFRGTVADLAAILGSTSTPTGGTTVTGGIIPPSIASQDPDLSEIPGMFPAGQAFDGPTAAIWTDERAAAANLHSKKALDAVNALTQKTASDDADAAGHLQQITDSVAALTAMVHTLGSAVSTGGVDVVALGAQVAAELPAHLTLTVTVGAR